MLGLILGMYNYAIFLAKGFGIDRDYDLSNRWLEKAALQKPYLSLGSQQLVVNIGVAEAENALGTAFREGRGVDVNMKKAAEWFVKSANHGCLQGMNNLAMCLQNGDGLQEDLKSAASWLERAADAGLAEAQLNFASALVRGDGVEINLHRARSYFQLAADQGVPGALMGLQQLERSTGGGPSFRQDTTQNAESDKLMERCQKNDLQALFLLAKNYEKGEGGFREDWKKAEQCFQKAFEAKHPQAAFALASLCLKKLKNPPRAFEFCLKAAEAGNQRLRYSLLGSMLLDTGAQGTRNTREGGLKGQKEGDN
jgi:TPR repeat protein